MIALHRAPSAARPRRGALSTGWLALLGLLVLVLAFGGCVAGRYNQIITHETSVEARFSEIQNQYKRRFDLVPQLVETVSGAADFERSTLQAVTDARASVGRITIDESALSDPQKVQAFFQAQEGLGQALSRLFALSENYPQLRATQGFLSLQDQLEGTENRIAVARRDYIDEVNAYNLSVRRFPGNVVAGLFGFERMPQLEFDEPVTERPQIDFGGQGG